jgi:prepilin-type N-terminal cleavage/methylation domain-containing protein
MKHESAIKHKPFIKHKEQGLTLVEIIVAIAVFAIIMLALSGTIVNGLQVRRKNSAQAQAVAYANAVIEAYKKDWSLESKYIAYNPDDSSTFPTQLTSSTNLPFPASGIKIDADLCASYNKSYPDKFAPLTKEQCKPNTLGAGHFSGGDIRFVTITIKDAQGKELVKLEAQIGKPVL